MIKLINNMNGSKTYAGCVDNLFYGSERIINEDGTITI